jgi:hypothetical protein
MTGILLCTSLARSFGFVVRMVQERISPPYPFQCSQSPAKAKGRPLFIRR